MDVTGRNIPDFKERTTLNDILYVIYYNNCASFSLKNKIEKIELSECVLNAHLQNAGFIKIKKTQWINPLNMIAVSHKPREIVLSNGEHFKISRRFWYLVKSIK